jgi:hypothetical protein
MTGVLAHWITSLVMVGHYMDRPDASVVAKHVGTASHGGEDDVPALSVLPSLAYTIQYLKAIIWYPFLRASIDNNDNAASSRRDSSERSRKDNRAASTTTSTMHPLLAKMLPQLAFFWHSYGPGVQPLLVLSVFLTIVWNLFVSFPTRSRNYALALPSSNIATATAAYADAETAAYAHVDPFSWARILFLMSSGSTLACIFLYGRITFPIPDLVAGSNVLKAVRHESCGAVSTKSNKPKHATATTDMAWSERYKSISTENRFRLATKVAIMRILDAVVACVLLARTELTCHATGHCPQSPTWWELAQILYRPKEEATVFSTLRSDMVATLVTLSSVVLITVLLLLAQLVTLEKSYLAIMGYISGEWKLVPDSACGTTAPAQWDPRRRYKRGDLIVHSYPGFHPSIYMATSNSPEGRPFDLSLRATHDLFRQDLGHVSTSMVISRCSSIHRVYMMGIGILGLYYAVRGGHISSLATAVVANLIASFGLVHVGLMDHDELQTIASEINGFN